MNKSNIKHPKPKICIIGLGYVGLPLAVEFGKKYQTIGFDLNTGRINELKQGIDKTLEQTKDQIESASNLIFTDSDADISDCNIYIVTVPTPVDDYKNPDLSPVKSASETVGKVLSNGDIVIFESTVFPGCTEEICVPILEKESGLTYNESFYCGYSPERINPGDKDHTLTKIVKVTSGSTPKTANIVNELYQSIIPAGTHLAPNIATAEAAKVIENIQRDVNIALMNEFSMIFDKLNINTKDVLDAAGTKWNFLKFHPGLVGGHCIGVDPYYLTYKAQSIGFHPEMILSGRRTNDRMGKYVAQKVIQDMTNAGINPVGATIGIYGITFKPNCPDIRNTKVIDIINELKKYNCNIIVTDPWANKVEVKQ
jgi:UDP-N-acetyl-D-galactosamine dehydrogenase